MLYQNHAWKRNHRFTSRFSLSLLLLISQMVVDELDYLNCCPYSAPLPLKGYTTEPAPLRLCLVSVTDHVSEKNPPPPPFECRERERMQNLEFYYIRNRKKVNSPYILFYFNSWEGHRWFTTVTSNE